MKLSINKEEGSCVLKGRKEKTERKSSSEKEEGGRKKRKKRSN